MFCVYWGVGSRDPLTWAGICSVSQVWWISRGMDRLADRIFRCPLRLGTSLAINEGKSPDVCCGAGLSARIIPGSTPLPLSPWPHETDARGTGGTLPGWVIRGTIPVISGYVSTTKLTRRLYTQRQQCRARDPCIMIRYPYRTINSWTTLPLQCHLYINSQLVIVVSFGKTKWAYGNEWMLLYATFVKCPWTNQCTTTGI